MSENSEKFPKTFEKFAKKNFPKNLKKGRIYEKCIYVAVCKPAEICIHEIEFKNC